MNIRKGYTTVIEKMESIDLSKARHQLLTVPATWILVIFIAGWVGKVWIAEAVGVTPVDKHDADIKTLVDAGEQRDTAIRAVGMKVDGLTFELRINWAYEKLEKAETELIDHLDEADHNIPNWEQQKRKLERKIALAKEYKQCVLTVNDNSCSVIQRQLLQ